jgi:hypothetical protein
MYTSQGLGASEKKNKQKNTIQYILYVLQSNLSYVTFQRNSEIWSHKTGGRLIQV